MPIDVKWYDEHKAAVHFRHTGQWTWDELYQCIEDARLMMREVPDQTVHIIAELYNSRLPNGVMSVHGVSAIRNPEPNLGSIIAVSDSLFITKLLEISGKVNKSVAQRYRSARTMEEALAMVRAHNAST